jgi:hypothetical protein
MQLKSCVSLGSIDYGNNNFFEVMRDSGGKVILCTHEEDPGEENEDGTWDSEGMSIGEFVDDISDRPDFVEIMGELMVILKEE